MPILDPQMRDATKGRFRQAMQKGDAATILALAPLIDQMPAHEQTALMEVMFCQIPSAPLEAVQAALPLAPWDSKALEYAAQYNRLEWVEHFLPLSTPTSCVRALMESSDNLRIGVIERLWDRVDEEARINAMGHMLESLASLSTPDASWDDPHFMKNLEQCSRPLVKFLQTLTMELPPEQVCRAAIATVSDYEFALQFRYDALLAHAIEQGAWHDPVHYHALKEETSLPQSRAAWQSLGLEKTTPLVSATAPARRM